MQFETRRLSLVTIVVALWACGSETPRGSDVAGGAPDSGETTGSYAPAPDTNRPPMEGADGCAEACETGPQGPPAVQLAEDGRAALDIVVPPGTSDAVRSHAETLRKQLDRITGGEFAIVEGEGSKGITLAVAENIAVAEAPDPSDSSPFGREDYLIRTHEEGVYLVGASELAVRHAVWDLLHRAGYRQYFPGDTWEVVPDEPNLTVAASELESPAFLWRRLGFSYGSWKDNERRLEDWRQKNRANGAFPLRSGHTWGAIIRANRKTFEDHPEYLGRDDRGNPTRKLCVTRPAVQQMAIDWAIDWLENRPDEDSVSMDPSDGGGWGGCPRDQKKLGSPSNRAVFLANKVAKGINAHFEEPKFVGIYAYNQHQWAPTISIHPRVIPSVATAFLEQGNTAKKLFREWSKAGARRMGLYDYYNSPSWSNDLPGEQRASSPHYVAHSLRRYHDAGARFFTMETSDAWGPTGLGHWMAIQIGWEIDEHSAEMLRRELRRDFLNRAFRKASGPMDEFYALLDRDHELLISEHLVGRMYRTLERARNEAETEAVRERIRDLILYTRYVDLFRDYEYADTKNRQQRFEEFLRFAYRIHDTHMAHSLARYRRTAGEDDAVSIPKHADWQIEEKKNPWKNSDPFSETRIRKFLQRGISSHELRAFQRREFDRDLVPAEPLDLDRSKKGRIRAGGGRHDNLQGRALNRAFDGFTRARSERDNGIVALYTWVPKGVSTPFRIAFSVSAENIHGATTGGDLPVELFALADPDSPTARDAVAIPVDHSVHRSSFEVAAPGLYRLDFSGQDRFFDIRMRNETPELRQTYELSPDQWVQPTNRASYIFYVPEGTKRVGGYATPGADFGDFVERPDGSVAIDFENLDRPGYFSVQVRNGEDGELWRLDNLPTRKRLLLTVPPQVADSPDELLLPRRVVRADAP